MSFCMENMYKKIGTVAPIQSSQQEISRLSIGFEKLDRDEFDPEKCYDYVANIGVKWARIQSGWCKTEKAKGVYDFAWIDSIVDNLLSRGLIPWVCLCYGNELYDELANNKTGSIGRPPIHSQEAKDAWINYVKAFSLHFKGRVRHFELWNEPDGIWCWKHGVSAEEYAQFAIATSKAVREVLPGAFIIGGAMAMHSLGYCQTLLKNGLSDHIDAYSFHYYRTDPESRYLEFLSALRALIDQYNPNIKLIQGETGCHSHPSTCGAIWPGHWTEQVQAKYLARRICLDMMTDVYFASYFTTVDMYENLNDEFALEKNKSNYGFYGVLREEFDENGNATGVYSPKPSYYTLSTICSLFRNDAEKTTLPILFTENLNAKHIYRNYDCPGRNDADKRYFSGALKRPNGSCAFIYWAATDLMTCEYHSLTAIDYTGVKGKPRLIDILDGSVYEIPQENIEVKSDDSGFIRDLPMCDYPMMITFGDFAEL